MSKELTPSAQNKTSIGKLTEEQVELIKNTVAREATDMEISLFVAVANKTGLDPFTKQIHFIKRRTWNKETKKYDEIGSIQCGIDGYRAIAAKTREHAGTDNAVTEEKDGLPIKSSVTVYRMVEGERRAFSSSARFSEYAQSYNGELSGLWKKMPFLMLEKCAEALALRKAFPNELSGIYTNEEMQQADNVIETKKIKTVVIETKEEPKDEKPNTNSLKNRIVLLMKSNGLQPVDNTPEAWAHAVKANMDMDLVEENYEKIIEVLQNTVQPPQE